MTKKIDIDPKLSEQLLKGLTKSLYASGVFDDEDIKDRKSLASAVRRVLDNGGIDGMTIDHTSSLLTVARKYKKNNEFNYARIFYATYFEHQINDLIHLYCLKKGINNKTQSTIIQSVNIWGKFTWLIALMEYPTFNKGHLNTIKLLADSRNSFVHYKWKDNPDFNKVIDSEKEKNQLVTEFEKIEKAIKYFKNYCNRIKFKGNKNRIEKLIKNSR